MVSAVRFAVMGTGTGAHPASAAVVKDFLIRYRQEPRAKDVFVQILFAVAQVAFGTYWSSRIISCAAKASGVKPLFSNLPNTVW
jgi:hypothetical protein